MAFTSPSVANKNNIFQVRPRILSLTTGLFENTPVEGVRPTVNMAVLIVNADPVSASVKILGYYLSGTMNVLYVLELLNLQPGEGVTRSYYAQFNAFEFQFETSSQNVEISLWGKNPAGNLVAAHRVLPSELKPLILY